MRGVFRQVPKPGNYLVSFRMLLWSSWGGTPVKLSLEDTASAYPPHLSEVFCNAKTKFKRRRCIPFIQILKPKNVAHVTSDVDQSDHGQDATDIVEGGTDGDVNDDRHDGKSSLEDAASAFSRHLSEVFFDGRTHFTRGRLPFLQILEPETVAHLINDGGQLDQGRDGTDICEERTDGHGNAEGDDGSADRINGRDNHDNCENDVDDGADTSGDRNDHADGDYIKCEEDDDEHRDDNDDDDDYYQSIQHPFVSPRDI
ncbi:hypothetical protein KP509_16G068400 [Ceratopteris richardii]|uniref:Uncharacterized protein n=1 Tax=Ceratopteris richardii TaxID=49495 RepID=A0A8T2SZN0_CERRI|nr:hypothetical protein KP509_16G068400 [Ceratopteris richardii]